MINRIFINHKIVAAVAEGLDTLTHISNDPSIQVAKAQHERGKLTVSEKIEISFNHTWQEIEPVDKDLKKDHGFRRVITGYGIWNGEKIYAAFFDSTIKGGSIDEECEEKYIRLVDLAKQENKKLFIDWDSGGADISIGIRSLDAYRKIFTKQHEISGVIPVFSLITGRSAGGSAYGPVMTDTICMIDEISMIAPTGPEVMGVATGQVHTAEDLGGSKLHAKESGEAHYRAKTYEESIEIAKKYFSYFPDSYQMIPPNKLTVEKPKEISLAAIINEAKINEDNDLPANWDVNVFIDAVVDRNSFFEYQKEFGKEAVVGFARIDGRVIGIIANQRNYNGGQISSMAASKIRRTIQLFNSFNMPILTFMDTPGFSVSPEESKKQILSNGAAVLKVYADIKVPSIMLLIGKGYGGAYTAMAPKNSFYENNMNRQYGLDMSEVAVVGAAAGIGFSFKKEFQEVTKLTDDAKTEGIRKLKRTYREDLLNIDKAVEYDYLKKLPTDPAVIRQTLINDFNELAKEYAAWYEMVLKELNKYKAINPNLFEVFSKGLRGVWPV